MAASITATASQAVSSREEDVRYERIKQYSVAQILGVWAAAALPMSVLAWIVAPVVDDHFSGAGNVPMVKALLLLLTAGLVWQWGFASLSHLGSGPPTEAQRHDVTVAAVHGVRTGVLEISEVELGFAAIRPVSNVMSIDEVCMAAAWLHRAHRAPGEAPRRRRGTLMPCSSQRRAPRTGLGLCASRWRESSLDCRLKSPLRNGLLAITGTCSDGYAPRSPSRPDLGRVLGSAIGLPRLA